MINWNYFLQDVEGGFTIDALTVIYLVVYHLFCTYVVLYVQPNSTNVVMILTFSILSPPENLCGLNLTDVLAFVTGATFIPPMGFPRQVHVIVCIQDIFFFQ